MTTPNEIPPLPERPLEPLPTYTASGRPATWSERIVFQLWIVCALFTVVATLIMFLIDKFRG